MQKYIVEVYSQKFVKLAEIGPVSYEKARKHAKGYKFKGFLVAITEEELINVDDTLV